MQFSPPKAGRPPPGPLKGLGGICLPLSNRNESVMMEPVELDRQKGMNQMQTPGTGSILPDGST